MPLAGRFPRLHCSCLTAGGFHGNGSQTRALASLLTFLGLWAPLALPIKPWVCVGAGALRGEPGGGHSGGPVQPGPRVCWHGALVRPGAHTWVCGGTGYLLPQRLYQNTKVPSGPCHRRQEERQLSPQAGCGVALGAGQASVR